jgi:hypothetical protein
MAKALFVRMASAVGLVALSLIFLGLVPLLNADPSAGASLVNRSLVNRAPAASVNREFKGDRLPLPSDTNSAFSKNEPQRSQAPKEIPDGCDPSFSPITAPQLAYVYGRCTT